MKLKSRPSRRKITISRLSNTKTPLEVTRNIIFQLNSLNLNFLVTIMTQGRMMIGLPELTLQIKWDGTLFNARLKMNNYLTKWSMQQIMQNIIKEIQIIKLWSQIYLKFVKYRKRTVQESSTVHG